MTWVRCGITDRTHGAHRIHVEALNRFGLDTPR